MDAHLEGCKCQSKYAILKVQAIKQKRRGYSSSLPSFSLTENGIIDFILSFYMYALYAGDSAMAGRRTSLVLVSTVSNNPVGNRQSTFMDMSAAKKKDSLASSSFLSFFFWSRKKRKKESLSYPKRHWRWMVLCPVRTPHVCYTIHPGIGYQGARLPSYQSYSTFKADVHVMHTAHAPQLLDVQYR